VAPSTSLVALQRCEREFSLRQLAFERGELRPFACKLSRLWRQFLQASSGGLADTLSDTLTENTKWKLADTLEARSGSLKQKYATELAGRGSVDRFIRGPSKGLRSGLSVQLQSALRLASARHPT
jgi:hypothetical protein